METRKHSATATLLVALRLLSIHGLGLYALIASVLFVPGTARTAAFQELFTQDIEVFDTIFDPCSGEYVTLSGIIQFRLQYTFNANGGLDAYMVENNQGISGIGASGSSYQFAGAVTQSVHFANAGPGFRVAFTLNSLLIGHGNTPNAMIHQEFMLTIDANGRLVATLDRFSASCN